jgi:DNA ligase (NAD+)
MIPKPTQCPYCEGPVVLIKGNLQCETRWCPGRLIEDLTFVGSKEGLGIEALGQEIARKLVQDGYVTTLSDLFEFGQELADWHLKDPERFNQVMAKRGFGSEAVKLYLGIAEARDSREWERWIVALNVEGVSKTTGKQIAMALGLQDLESFPTRLLEVPGLGIEGLDKAATTSITDWALDLENLNLCRKLHETGCRPKSLKKVLEVGEGPCSGMIVCITGEHLGMERDEIQVHLSKLGAVVKSGVSKKLTHLIAGAGAGPSKLQKARELGILVLNTEWLQKTLTEADIDIGVGNGGFELNLDEF